MDFKSIVFEYYTVDSLIKKSPRKINQPFCAFGYKGKLFFSNNLIFDYSDKIKAETLKGQIAQKGIARGVAKIVKKTSEIDKVKNGDILVTQMTFPAFLPAMKKAAAFITNEGGITCHAAIVAREMKKPCIIGTRIATKVLHDGDLVEVDANKGLVMILKK